MKGICKNCAKEFETSKNVRKEAEKAILESRFYEWVKKYKENRE